ncbi:MAG: hypothetical protein GY839_00080 [candidate division Zixibacteria bacterium]|nr:hypothetical protein [candidate division Zixibacteria bacterium]
MTKMPAGLTSSVTANEKRFILQTEFLAPSTGSGSQVKAMTSTSRIKTTVAIEGQVVHKVEKGFAQPHDTDDGFIAAERAVKQQHISVGRIVASKPREFLANVSELTISPEDRLGVISGVGEVIQVDLGDLSNLPKQTGFKQQILESMELNRNLVQAISQNTRMGKLKKMVGTVDDKTFMLIGYSGKTYLLCLTDDVDVSSVFQELDKVKA